MRYVEAYDLVLPSDRILTVMNGWMAIDQSKTEHPQSAHYGASCYESEPTIISQSEVRFNLEMLSAHRFCRFVDFCSSSFDLCDHKHFHPPGSLVCSGRCIRLFLGPGKL
jgi:hypothetical protein